MELKVKIINSSWKELWYNQYIGEEVIVDSKSIRKIIDGDIFYKIYLTDSLREKLKYDANPDTKPIDDDNYGIYKCDTNFQQVIRKEKLKALNNENSIYS